MWQDVSKEGDMDSLIEKVEVCPACGQTGRMLYGSLVDRFIDRRSNDLMWSFKQCSACQHGWLDPRYTPESIILAYRNYSDAMWEKPRTLSTSKWKRIVKHGYLAGYYGYALGVPSASLIAGKLIKKIFPDLAGRFDKQIMYLTQKKDGHLLDIGSGDGWFLENMSDFGWNSRGLDIDETSANKVRQRGIPVDVGLLKQQNYPDNYFDAITMKHAIEHLHNPVEDLLTCHRILKPGGKLVIITPNIQSLAHQRFGENWQGLETPRHLNIFSTASLRIMLETVDFKIVLLKTSNLGAKNSWLKSHQIETNGVYSKLTRYSLADRLRASFFNFHERLSISRGHGVGEEIVAICEAKARC